MKKTMESDPFLEKRLVQYDRWLAEGRIAYSSKVVPVVESLQAEQWVLPTEQALKILGDARSIALQKCECRTHYNRCDKPLEVCFLLNSIGDKFVAKGSARHVSLGEAAGVLREANENGLVHLTLYMPDHEVFALCSCCSCCCHDLQIVKQFGRQDIMVRSEYVAVTDRDVCIHCGECEERCFFGARVFENGQMYDNTAACLGCGLCVSVCPAEAVSMQRRESGMG